MKHGFIVMIALVSLPLSSLVMADEAEDAFYEGRRLFSVQDYDEAAAAFREANRLRPNWKIYYNIGQCEAAAKRYGLALEAFQAYMAHGGDDIPETRRDEVLKEIERTRLLVGSIEIIAPEGAKVVIDDVIRGETPLSGALLVAAGIDHNVAILKNGETLLNKPVKVNGGHIRTINASSDNGTIGSDPVVREDLTPASPEESVIEEESIEEEMAPESPKTKSKLMLPGWITLGVGVATLIVGGVTGGMALSLNKDLDEVCGSGPCPASQQSKQDKLDTMVLTTNILVPVGAACAIAGVVLVVLGNRQNKRVSLMPIVNPVLVGSTISWRF